MKQLHQIKDENGKVLMERVVDLSDEIANEWINPMPTTIQTIKEAEEKFGEIFPEKADIKLNRKQLREAYKSHITQTLIAVFESELAELGEIGGGYTGFENDIQWGVKKGIADERARTRSHLTEVINYLKQK